MSEIHAEIFVIVVAFLKIKDYSEGSYDQNMTLSTIFSLLLIPWQPNLVWWYIIRSQSVQWKKLDFSLHSGSRSHWKVKMLMFVQVISSKPPNILFPNLVLWCIIMQEFMWSKYYNVYCIFWTADPFATKLGLIVHYHKPECFMEKLECCVQGKSHSKISRCQWTFVQMIPSEMLVCCLQVEGHSEGSFNQIWLFLPYLLNCWSFGDQI